MHLGSGSSECRWDYFVNQCLAASSGACNPYKVGDGVCDEGCMKYAECYRDAGDCLGIQIGKAFEEEEHTFPSGATITVADYKPFDKYFAEEKRIALQAQAVVDDETFCSAGPTTTTTTPTIHRMEATTMVAAATTTILLGTTITAAAASTASRWR